MQCPQCESPLVDVNRTSATQQLRCARCAARFEFDGIDGPARVIQRNFRAWRSFWLGLASIVLLFITGIPAIWYGIRALLEMRHQRTLSRDRTAALVGTGLGFLFGILLGGCVFLAGAVAILTLFTYNESRDPQLVQQAVDKVAAISVPDILTPRRSVELLNLQTHVTWDDAADEDEPRTVGLRLIFFQKALNMNYPQLNQFLRENRLSRDMELDNRQVETRSWSMCDQPVEIFHEIYDVVDVGAAPDDPEESAGGDQSRTGTRLTPKMHRYYGYVVGENGAVGLSVVELDPPRKLGESAIRKLFESVQFRNSKSR